MVKNYLTGSKVKLVKFSDRHITPQYHSWLNDQEVNRYLHVGRIPVGYSELVVPAAADNTVIRFAIMSNVGIDSADKLWQDKDYKYYVGTTTIHHIDWISKKAEVGYMIGEKAYWGAGLATEIVGLLVDYCFNKLNLNKVTAGVIEGNEGSMKVLEKNGFKQYAIEEQDFYLENKYLNSHRFHIFQEWHKS